MRDELQTVCDEFIKDRDLAKYIFMWDSSYMHPICAGILADKKQAVSEEHLKECRQMIKEKTTILSDFRGHGLAPMTCMLAISGQPEKLVSDALKISQELKKDYWSSPYLPLVSMIVARMAEESQFSYIIEKTKKIYELMKKKHPLLTSAEDGPFAAMLAFAESSPEVITAEAEKCYQLLKNKFFSGNAVQSLSHVLALGEGSAESKCRKFEQLFEILKEKGYKYGTDYELATLGALSNMPCDVSVMAEDMIAVVQYLAKQKGYGIFGASKRQRLMHGAMLVCRVYAGTENNQVMNHVAINSTLAQIAAQQAAMCAAIAASTAAGAASN